jgi:hypothetical protein
VTTITYVIFWGGFPACGHMLTNLQSIAILVIPALINPDIFDGSLFNYLILTLFYYLMILFTYWMMISRVSKSKKYLTKFYTSHNRLYKYIFVPAILFFGILVVHSDDIFLTNPGYSYQHFREGFGFIWVLYILSISILYELFIFKVNTQTSLDVQDGIKNMDKFLCTT